MSHDLVLAGGRVVDPETGFDRVCDVGIDGDSVTAVGDRLDGATTVDVGGLVVAPGFVDLHSHAQTLPGRRLHACDGVTTAGIGAGRVPVPADPLCGSAEISTPFFWRSAVSVSSVPST